MGHGLGCVARSAAVWEFVVPEGDVCLWPRSLYRSIWKGTLNGAVIGRNVAGRGGWCGDLFDWSVQKWLAKCLRSEPTDRRRVETKVGQLLLAAVAFQASERKGVDFLGVDVRIFPQLETTC
jgi:hypothetical protein